MIMAMSTARRKRKRLTACDSQVQIEVWMPQLFTPSPALTFILKLLVTYLFTAMQKMNLTCFSSLRHNLKREIVIFVQSLFFQ